MSARFICQKHYISRTRSLPFSGPSFVNVSFLVPSEPVPLFSIFPLATHMAPDLFCMSSRSPVHAPGLHAARFALHTPPDPMGSEISHAIISIQIEPGVSELGDGFVLRLDVRLTRSVYHSNLQSLLSPARF